MCSPLGPSFAGSKVAEVKEFIRHKIPRTKFSIRTSELGIKPHIFRLIKEA